MKQFLLIFCFALFSYSAFAQPKGVERPKLVVGLVVDQMRWDYLYRFYDRYSAKGFKRLLGEGFSCEQAMINYIPTYTAPGHACIYTGSVPSIHGIAGNDWIDNLSGKAVYCTEDTTVSPVGGSLFAGMMSPRNLLASTITDELKLATNFRSRVFGISIKDRGAILPAGHLANGAYWYDDSTGSLVSSNYYGPVLPGWLTDFNNRHLSDSFSRKTWDLLYASNSYTQSLADSNRYEGRFSNEKSSAFPHVNSRFSYANIRRIPAGNTYTLEAAKACVAGANLGGEGYTDFLCVSLSSTDYIGHQFSPNSVEVEDTYLRLDKDIADFLAYLDERVGKGNYLFFLTADHGGAHNPGYLADIKMPGGNDMEMKAWHDLGAYTKQVFGQDSLISALNNYQVVLNERKIATAGINREDLKQKIISYFYMQPHVAYVVDMEDVSKTALPDPIKTMAINGYNRNRSGALLIVFNPGWFYGYSPTGTTHGTWHPYDAHIPLLWYGWKVPKGSTSRMVHMEDITPTLANMLHIQIPNGCIGHAIQEIMK